MSQSKEEKKHFYLRHNDALMNSTKLSMKAKQSILLSKAENTVNAYESDWDDFVDWCNYQKVSYFPATPETIVNYINDLADYAKANTIARRISAISENYNASGARENPCMSPLVKQALRGIRPRRSRCYCSDSKSTRFSIGCRTSFKKMVNCQWHYIWTCISGLY